MIKFFRNIRHKLLNEGKTTNYLKYAIGEIVLVVIGILIALQVNNWNGSRIEQLKIKEYAKSLIEDLKSDIEMLSVSLSQAEKKFKAIDSLRVYVNQIANSDLSNTDLYIMTHDIIYRPYKWNRSTLNELKNSGGLSYITNDSILKRLVAYESFSSHLDEDFEFDKSNANKGDNMIAQLLDLNSSYFPNLDERDSDKPFTEIFGTEEYKLSKSNDHKLITYDRAFIQKFVNTFILIQDNYDVRANTEMPKIIEDAKRLIALLQTEYQL